jgi:dienelactone hydrolase
MMPLKNDRPLLRKRMQVALEQLQGQSKWPSIPRKVATFGFCFGVAVRWSWRVPVRR